MSGDAHVLRARAGDGGSSQLLAPSVGVFTPSVREGALVSAGESVGTIDVLGVLRELIVPVGVTGRIISRVGGGRSRVPVQYGDSLLTVSTVTIAGVAETSAIGGFERHGELCFVAPMSGRFYSRPSPTEAAFVVAGDIVHRGRTVGLLEVMKTFNRLVYKGDGLPERAKVEKVVPSEGDDVVRGDVILALRSLAEN